jgi:RimJ/RimL family protein N-acetyltransferase
MTPSVIALNEGPSGRELKFPATPLADEVVSLRPWAEADVPANLMLFADPTVQRYSWPHANPYTEDDARRFFAEQRDARLRGVELNFALVEPADPDAVLGGGTLYDVDPEQKRAGVGYWLAPEARGRGIATRAVGLLARWAFEELGVVRLELTTAPDNPASQAVALRSGFTKEAVLRSHMPFKGGRRDTVVFSLLAGELP